MLQRPWIVPANLWFLTDSFAIDRIRHFTVQADLLNLRHVGVVRPRLNVIVHGLCLQSVTVSVTAPIIK